MTITTKELRDVRSAAEAARDAMNPRLESFVTVVANPLLMLRLADAAHPGQQALAAQADLIDLPRLARALTIMGCAGPDGQEHCAASLGSFVNQLTAAVERFGSAA